MFTELHAKHIELEEWVVMTTSLDRCYIKTVNLQLGTACRQPELDAMTWLELPLTRSAQ